jgi:hypothetical protein
MMKMMVGFFFLPGGHGWTNGYLKRLAQEKDKGWEKQRESKHRSLWMALVLSLFNFL